MSSELRISAEMTRCDPVGGDHFETVRGNQTVSVKQDQTVLVDGSRSEVVVGKAEQRVKQSRTTRVDGLDRQEDRRA